MSSKRLAPQRRRPASVDSAADRASAILEIDLDAVQRNWRLLQGKVGKAVQCAAVVKADGYGLGAGRVAKALLAAGCKTFFVATLGEAEELRGLLAGATIYVLAGLQQDTAPVYRQFDLRPVLNSADEIDMLTEGASGNGKNIAACIAV